MLLIPCPYCGPRWETEFRYAGEAHMERPSPACDEERWTAYLHLRDNARGEHAERWRHLHGCGMFFNVRRNTQTDAISDSYAAGHRRSAAGGEI